MSISIKLPKELKSSTRGQMNEFHWTIFLQVQTYIKIWSDSKPTFTELPLLRFFNYCSFTFQNLILTWSLSSATIGISVSTLGVNKLAGSEKKVATFQMVTDVGDKNVKDDLWMLLTD